MGRIKVEPWGPVESLLLATGIGRADQLAKVQEIGLNRTVNVLMDELEIRCDPLPLEVPVHVQFEITCVNECVGRVITVDRKGASATAGWSDSALVQIRLDVLDLLDGIFGQSDCHRHATRKVTRPRSTWADLIAKAETDPHAVKQTVRSTNSAVHSLLSACLTQPEDLGALSLRFGSDKWAGFHWYTQHYEHHFAQFRHKPVRLLEIGIGGYDDAERGGASLGMWQRYFRRGLIYGLDIAEKSLVRSTRIRAVQGDQNDPNFLDNLGGELGPFDIIIDDGSHINEHVRTSFRALFPHVRLGGLYVIEDLQTSYWPRLGGTDANVASEGTSVGMVKNLIDGLHYEEFVNSGRKDPSYTDQYVAGLHLYHNLAIIEKGSNAEGSTAQLLSSPSAFANNDTVAAQG